MEESLKNKELEPVKIVDNTPSVEDELVEKITKRVIAETMKTIRPLLEKLQEVAEAGTSQQQSQQLPTSTSNTQKLSHEEQVKQIQATADSRVKSLEHKIAKKMQQRQMKMSRHQ